ncbi:alpha/beta hydrolase [Aquimarina mytili]|uniref:Platelet-activating factor acetylhydrolase n=2 Tax=Aquimarina mytili TaxID=874423 RepID=A0A937A196_9FLAO|nr:hypothetical protein [Aquimarina mytili]MBL0682579.1 hypothetical protein [Aquimarina mytili]
MRTIEFLFLISSAGFFITLFTQHSKLKKWTFYFSVLFLILHICIENSRWQMYLAYISFVIGMLLFYQSTLKKWIKTVLVTFGILALVLSTVLGVIMPVMKFPEPTGPFSVGLQSVYIEDQTRQEVLTKEIGDYRKLKLHIWYPSDHKITEPKRYMDQGYAEAFVKSKNMPSFIATHFNLTKTHIQKLLPITNNTQLPLIVLSHGLLWNSEMYTSIIEEVVSQGYIVVGIDHTYESFLTEYQGKKIAWSQDNIDSMNKGLDFDYVNKKMEVALNGKDSLLRNKATYEIIQHLPYFKSLDRWSNDISFVIDQLEIMNSDHNGFLFQKLDVDKIGLLGHSWGGASVVQNASVNKRIKGVINMDGAQFGRLIDTRLDVPLMVMHADRDYKSFFTPNFYVYERVAKNDFFLVTIATTGHANFGDLSYWTKIHALTETGSIAPERMTHITNELILNFFDTYIKDENNDMIHNFPAGDYPEVSISHKNKSSKSLTKK